MCLHFIKMANENNDFVENVLVDHRGYQCKIICSLHYYIKQSHLSAD